MFERIITSLQELLAPLNLSDKSSQSLITILLVIGILLFAIIIDIIMRKVVLVTIDKAIAKTEMKWDDILMEHRFFRRAVHIVPLLILSSTAERVFQLNPDWLHPFQIIVQITIIVLIIMVINSFLKAINDIYLSYPGSKNRPIKGFIQTIQIVILIFGFITAFSILMGQSPLVIIGGLGAFAAVLMLIFKDSILGFVAGIQISFNDLVRLGDWISMPKYGADGTVIDLALTTIKIQNWDKTISTIPSYALISDSFQNWRGMEESGGRRIKRSIHIDLNSIQFADDEMLNRFKKIALIKDYIEKKETELAQYNQKNNINNEVVVNGRRQTNIGIFRNYIKAYLQQKKEIHQEMTFLVRQLQTTDHGLPLEIYVFSKIQDWAAYEELQSDIFDHILSAVNSFELKLYQQPAGSDIQLLKSK